MSDSAEGLPFGLSDRHEVDLFVLLEQQLQQLIERHRDSRKTIEEMQGVIGERDRQIALLEMQAGESVELRTRVASRIDGLVAEIDRLQSAAEEPTGGDPAATSA